MSTILTRSNSGGNTESITPVQKINNDSIPLTIGMPVYITTPGNVARAKAISNSQAYMFGLVDDISVPISSLVTITQDGIHAATTAQWDAVTGSVGGLVEGAIYYLGISNAALLTTVAPSISGQYVVKIGIAINSMQMLVNIEQPIGI